MPLPTTSGRLIMLAHDAGRDILETICDELDRVGRDAAVLAAGVEAAPPEIFGGVYTPAEQREIVSKIFRAMLDKARP